MFEFPLRLKRMAIGAGVIIAVAVSCLGIVRAQRFTAPDAGVSYKCSTGTACVEGTSTGTPYGVYGQSSGGNGLEGKSSAAARSGVSGVQLGSSGIGVYAESHDTTGKYGALFAKADESATNIFYGYNSATHLSCLIDPYADLACKGSIYGVAGNVNVYGVRGDDGTTYGAGVEGFDESGGTGVYAGTSASTGTALISDLESTNGLVFYGMGLYGDCTINTYADLYCSGTITSGQTLEHRHHTSRGRHVLAFGSESTSAIIEDFGTAHVMRGVANVRIEAAFASTIERNSAYYVFLTPLGDTRGLYVTMKTPTGFQVHEAQGGRSNVGFDYRIVAHPGTLYCRWLQL